MNRAQRLRSALLGVGILAGLVALSAVLLLGWSWYRDPALQVLSVQCMPEEEIHIGTAVRCTVDVRSPWYRWPIAPPELMELPEGLQEIHIFSPRLHKVGMGRWTWQAEVIVQPYETGHFAGGSLQIQFTRTRAGDAAPMQVQLPDLTVTSRLTGVTPPELTAAGPLDESVGSTRHSWAYWLALGVMIGLVIFVLVSVMLRRESAAGSNALSTAERAELELNQLELSLPLPAELFFVRLTDILRRYVEGGFRLRATEQTTAEFLSTLASSQALDGERKTALTEFLQAADLVKFARAQATSAQMLDALAMARRFIRETALQENEVSAEPEGVADASL